jgi:hypothetical protein
MPGLDPDISAWADLTPRVLYMFSKIQGSSHGRTSGQGGRGDAACGAKVRPKRFPKHEAAFPKHID